MKDNILRLEAVLPDGSIMKTGGRSRKTSAGYDLTRLLVGSEGTLAVITEVTLKIQRIPKHSAVASCTFPSVKEAAAAASDTLHAGVPVRK